MTKNILNIDIEAWNQFVLQHPSGNIFQTAAIYQLYKSTSGYSPGVIVIGDEECIQGVLVYTIINEIGMQSIFSQRALITGGPLVTNNDERLLKILLAEYKKRISGTGVIYTQFRNHWDTSLWKETFALNNYKYTDHLNVVIDLTKDEDRLIAEMHKKRQKNIKRAKSKSLVIKSTKKRKDIDEICMLIKNTYQRINLPCPPASLFLNATNFLSDKVVFFGAWYNNKLIAARVYLLFKHKVFDWYAASNLRLSNLHANDLLPWEFMLWAKRNNYKMYDFMGAGRPNQHYGVREYKIRFGGNIENFGRYQCIHRPLMFQLGKTGIRLIKFFRTRKQKE